MELGDKIRVGYAQDWTGQATRKYRILRETTLSEFVCQAMPEVIQRVDGSKYVASPMTGLFLRSKGDFTEVHSEIIGG